MAETPRRPTDPEVLSPKPPDPEAEIQDSAPGLSNPALSRGDRPAASLGSLALFAIIVALLVGTLLYLFRPVAPTRKVEAILIRVTGAASNPAITVIDAPAGSYTVDLYSGSAPGDVGEQPATSFLEWRLSGSGADITLANLLKNGRSQDQAGEHPIAISRLPPGSYVIEIAGADTQGVMHAGAQTFDVRGIPAP